MRIGDESDRGEHLRIGTVPGPGNLDDPKKVTLPANVQNYAAIVQEDERRRISSRC